MPLLGQAFARGVVIEPDDAPLKIGDAALIDLDQLNDAGIALRQDDRPNVWPARYGLITPGRGPIRPGAGRYLRFSRLGLWCWTLPTTGAHPRVPNSGTRDFPP